MRIQALPSGSNGLTRSPATSTSSTQPDEANTRWPNPGGRIHEALSRKRLSALLARAKARRGTLDRRSDVFVNELRVALLETIVLSRAAGSCITAPMDCLLSSARHRPTQSEFSLPDVGDAGLLRSPASFFAVPAAFVVTWVPGLAVGIAVGTAEQVIGAARDKPPRFSMGHAALGGACLPAGGAALAFDYAGSQAGALVGSVPKIALTLLPALVAAPVALVLAASRARKARLDEVTQLDPKKLPPLPPADLPGAVVGVWFGGGGRFA